MTRWLVSAFLLSLSSQAFSFELCPATCNGQNPVTAFDFWKKAQQAGDPNTGKPIGSTMKMPSTEGGAADTTVSTDEFFNGQYGMNEFEKWSAKECGQSVNTDGDVLAMVPCNNEAMYRRAKYSVVSVHSPTGSAIPSMAVINQVFDQAKSPAAQQAQLKSVWSRPDAIALNHKNCFPVKGFETPGKDIFAIYALGEFCAQISASKIPNNYPVMLGAPADATSKLSGGAKAGVYIFGTDLNIIRVTAELNSPYQKNVSRSTVGYLFGQALHKESDSGKELKYDYTYNAGTIKQGTSTTFMAGPIPVTIEAGATGKVGIAFATRQAGFWANGHVVPFVDTTAFVSGGVNAVIAKAGVEATLNPLFRDTLDLYGLAAVASVPAVSNGQQYLTFTSSSQINFVNEVSALYGQVNLFLKIARPKFIGWKWKKYTFNLFNWDGIYAKGNIYSKDYINVPVYNLK